MKKALIQTRTTSYVTRYPEFLKLCDTQIEKCFWTHSEIKLEKDYQNLTTDLSETEKHGIVTVLKLFLAYELRVGEDYWLNRVMKKYPVPEIQRMASCFGHVELNVHAPFYNRINELLGLATDEFYNSYVNDPVLKERMEFIESLVCSKDDALSIAGFSMVEGAVLYSSFAFIKHFQNNGKNYLVNLVRGINQSAIDENLHSIGGSAIFRTQVMEEERTAEEMDELKKQCYQLADAILGHETQIINMIFSKGAIPGITAHQLVEFVKSRLNICLNNLGFESKYEVKYNPVAEWFYDALNKYQFNDFFTGIGREYTRDWDAISFGSVWQ